MATTNEVRRPVVLGRLTQVPSKQVWNDEKSASKFDVESGVDGIREYDVVCGKKANSNGGNEKFRLLIQRNRQAYQSTNTREAKKKIIERIIEHVHTAGGRFLKVEGEKILMEELSHDSCYEKVSHALRSARAPVSNVVRSKEELHKGFGSLLDVQKKLFYEYLEAEGLGLYDELPSVKPKSDSPISTGTTYQQQPAKVAVAGPAPMEDADSWGPDPFDRSRRNHLEIDHETLGYLAMLR